jgi:hypothetical protein
VCGICCSGALFDTVPVDEMEERSLAELFAVEQIGGRQQFRLRCPHLSDCRCTVYDRRPNVCRKYRCKTLVELSNDNITRDEALRRIAAIRQSMQELEPLLLPGELMHEARSRRHALQQRGGRIDKDDAAFVLKALALDLLLDRFLRAETKQLIQFDIKKAMDERSD